MKIDLTKLKMHSWFEDENGNIFENVPDLNLPDSKTLTYYSVFPCTYIEDVSEYSIHKKIDRKSKTFKHIASFRTSYGNEWSQRCIVAMVNSGDYTLEEAIYVYCHSCERCMNVLLYKYLNGEEGYEESSEEWIKCNTVCEWCRDEKIKEGEKNERTNKND